MMLPLLWESRAEKVVAGAAAVPCTAAEVLYFATETPDDCS
jgi:hypothetical protein